MNIMRKILLEIDRVTHDFYIKASDMKITAVEEYNIPSVTKDETIIRFMDFLRENMLNIKDYKVIVENELWNRIESKGKIVRYKPSTETIYVESDIEGYKKVFITPAGVLQCK